MSIETNPNLEEEMEVQLPVGNVTTPTTEAKVEKLSQKDAVLLYTKQALGHAAAPGVSLKDLVLTKPEDTNEIKAKKKALRKEIRLKLFEGFKANKITINAKKSDSDLKKYCSGLINNWLNKDPRFN